MNWLEDKLQIISLENLWNVSLVSMMKAPVL